MPLHLAKACFIQDFAKRPFIKTTVRHNPQKHKLPTEFGRIMKPGVRPWPALTEDNLCLNAAACSWLHKYFQLREQGVQVSLSSGRYSKLVQPCSIAFHIPTQAHYATMGNHLWAGIAMPLARFQVDRKEYSKFQAKPFDFVHTFEPDDWLIQPYVETRLPHHGLVLEHVGIPVPLMQHALRSAGNMRPGCSIQALFIGKRWVWHLPPQIVLANT